jgi:GntP family gluconate:H+ symporter
LGADLGTVILLGLVVAVPSILAGYFFAKTYGARIPIDPKPVVEETGQAERRLPSAVRSFAPIVVPVVLIALKSLADYPTNPLGEGTLRNLISFIGNPNVALLIGVFLAFLTVERLTGEVMGDWVADSLKDAGMIILITGAGGALGAVLRETAIADFITTSLSGMQLGVLLPFALAAALKTAQGSSTVAIITTAGIISPILGALGLAGGIGPALAVMAIGAGAMTVSHANDSYFWVVAQFSDMKVSEAYRLQTLASLVTGIVGLITVTILYLIFV